MTIISFTYKNKQSYKRQKGRDLNKEFKEETKLSPNCRAQEDVRGRFFHNHQLIPHVTQGEMRLRELQ